LALMSTQDCNQDEEQKLPQPSEEEAEVVADRRENGIGGVAGTAFEMAAAAVTIGLHVTNHSFDG